MQNNMELNELTDSKTVFQLKKELFYQLKQGETLGGTICSHIYAELTKKALKKSIKINLSEYQYNSVLKSCLCDRDLIDKYSIKLDNKVGHIVCLLASNKPMILGFVSQNKPICIYSLDKTLSRYERTVK